MSSATNGIKFTANATGTLPLDGCCIAFSGNFPGRTQASLFACAAALGAETRKAMTGEVTHLVTTQADLNKPSIKVGQAKDRGIFMVGLDWLLVSEQNSVKEQEFKHDLTSNNSNNSNASNTLDPSSGASGPKKRQASDPNAPEPKKSKLEASSGKTPVIGKSQVAKDWSVKVPVDEGCTLVGYGVHVDDDSVIWDATLK